VYQADAETVNAMHPLLLRTENVQQAFYEGIGLNWHWLAPGKQFACR
jgi:hypothetical protein